MEINLIYLVVNCSGIDHHPRCHRRHRQLTDPRHRSILHQMVSQSVSQSASQSVGWSVS